MTYSNNQSGLAWSSEKQTQSTSGCRIDLIYGYIPTGSPHGHTAFFNGGKVYDRPIGNLRVQNTGSIFEIVDNTNNLPPDTYHQ